MVKRAIVFAVAAGIVAGAPHALPKTGFNEGTLLKRLSTLPMLSTPTPPRVNTPPVFLSSANQVALGNFFTTSTFSTLNPNIQGLLNVAQSGGSIGSVEPAAATLILGWLNGLRVHIPASLVTGLKNWATGTADVGVQAVSSAASAPYAAIGTTVLGLLSPAGGLTPGGQTLVKSLISTLPALPLPVPGTPAPGSPALPIPSVSLPIPTVPAPGSLSPTLPLPPLSLPIPGAPAPGVPGVPSLPIPSLPIPAVPSLPIPDVPALGAPGIPSVPGVPSLPLPIPAAPIPGAPGAPSLPLPPLSNPIPAAPGAPSVIIPTIGLNPSVVMSLTAAATGGVASTLNTAQTSALVSFLTANAAAIPPTTRALLLSWISSAIVNPPSVSTVFGASISGGAAYTIPTSALSTVLATARGASVTPMLAGALGLAGSGLPVYYLSPVAMAALSAFVVNPAPATLAPDVSGQLMSWLVGVGVPAS